MPGAAHFLRGKTDTMFALPASMHQAVVAHLVEAQGAKISALHAAALSEVDNIAS